MCSCQGKPTCTARLEDCSAILTPNDSCERVASVYERRRANTVIGETNQGGDFIESLLHSTPRGKHLTYRGVHAKERQAAAGRGRSRVSTSKARSITSATFQSWRTSRQPGIR